MPAFWFTFKPANESPNGWPIESLRALIAKLNTGQDATEWWRLGNKSARPGDYAYLFKQGTPNGLIGIGTIISEPFKTSIETDPKVTWRAQVRFNNLVDPTEGFLLPLEEIADCITPTMIKAAKSGCIVPGEVDAELRSRLLRKDLTENPGDSISEADAFDVDLTNVEDERERIEKAIHVRRGQAAFRMALMRAYSGRCAVTGCAVEEILEAAHIAPYRGMSTNHVSNGLLLRADIHTLFDCGLLAFDPETRKIVIAEKLKGSGYEQLIGQKLRETVHPSDRPSRVSLEKHFEDFRSDLKNFSPARHKS